MVDLKYLMSITLLTLVIYSEITNSSTYSSPTNNNKYSNNGNVSINQAQQNSTACSSICLICNAVANSSSCSQCLPGYVILTTGFCAACPPGCLLCEGT